MKFTKSAAVGVIALSVGLIAWANSGGDSAAPADAGVKVAARAAADKAALRDYGAAQGALIVQGQTRNPDSFQLVSVGDMENGAVCYGFRAQNGFGGLTTGHASMMKGSVSTSEARYKKDCSGRAGADITAGTRAALDLARSARR